MSVEIRVGAPVWSIVRKVGAGSMPMLMSANAFYDHKKGEFRDVTQASHSGIALDSAGFVAMKRYGGYPWTMAQYAAIGALHPWDWWAAMDYCCEPEIAADRTEVRARVERTAESLAELRCHVVDLRDDGAEWAVMPMPILQGWDVDDYRRSVELTDRVLGGQWPAMVGIGSVCRRHLRGRDGVLRIFGEVAAAIPRTTKLHLFGVKSGALEYLAASPQMGSIDSCAWDMEARIDARKRQISNTLDHRVGNLRAWVAKQRDAVARAIAHREGMLL